MALAAVAALLSLAPVASANPQTGTQFGRVSIPSLGISFSLFEGDQQMCDGRESATLDEGVSHYPCSAFPWEIGTVFIAGHRTTHVAPFRRLNLLKKGDRIKIQTRRGTYLYEVQKLRIVSPDTRLNIEVPGRLLLSTCYPAGSDRSRLIVIAKEVMKQK